MRVEATATSMSWIPSESMWSAVRLSFELGISHWDEPLPDSISGPHQVHEMCRHDRFRFANVLSGWAEVEDGRIVAVGHAESSGLAMGATTVRVAKLGATFRAVPLPTLRPEPEVARSPDGDAVTFVQTVGGRTALPLPRRVSRRPFVQWSAPLVWTTLALTLRADGSSEVRLTGASTFPRHWVYDADGRLVLKSGLTDENTWLTEAFGERTPWGSYDTPALVVAVETELERQMSADIMHGDHVPEVRRIKKGAALTRQGDARDELYLLLDGVVSVDVDGQPLGEVGPGAILGERALLEGGRRTATLTAVTPVRVAAAPADAVDLDRLRELSRSHHREDEVSGSA
jgi:cyclic nucleotide-binding protein